MLNNTTIINYHHQIENIQIHNYVYNPHYLLGAGNFSKVYPAKHIVTGQSVALKIIELASLNDPKLVELHQLEMDILSKLHHLNVIRCYQIINVQSQCLLVTQICQQGDLNMLVKKEGYLSEQKIPSILRDILEGLLYLSSLNIVHRDLKTANILLSRGRAKIADFGLATYAKQNFRDMNIGSPLNMAPEGYIDCIYGPKTDVWSFGILIYQLLHGDTPYSSCKLDNDLRYHLSLPFNRSKIKPTLKMDLKELICLCLQVNQSKRISIAELKLTSYFKRIYYQLSHLNTPNIEYTQYNAQHSFPCAQYVSNDPHPVYSQQPIIHQQVIDHRPPIQLINSTSKDTPGRLFNTNLQQKTPFIDTQQHINPKALINLQENNKNINKTPSNNRDVIRLGRPISSQKFMNTLNFQRGQSKKKRLKSIDNKKPQYKYLIFSLPINLKLTVNLMHYTRCLYKCIQLMRKNHRGQQQSLKFMAGWLMLILDEINKKINNKEILFQGQNIQAQAQKLRQVRNEYQRRYSSSLKRYLKSFINRPSLEQVKAFFCEKYLTFDREIQSHKITELIELGHLIIILYDATRLMNKCQEELNYTRFLNYKPIESVLNWQEEQFTFSSYLSFKSMMVNS